MAKKAAKRQERHRTLGAGRIAALLLSLLLTAAILVFNPGAQLKAQLGDWGYVGIFLIMLLNNATVILPAPGLLAVFAAGSSYNFLLVGIAGGLGAALGELTGYLFGYGSLAFVKEEKSGIYRRVERWMQGNGFITILVLAALPNPFFDVAGITAGALKYPWWRFLVACAIGAVIKATVLAYLGRSLL
jgi:membrane protein DedA with SNARE-associated domain